jgi:hypothetical protein
MAKTPKEITNDILTSLRMDSAPERILIEMYLEKVIEQIKIETLKESK